MYGMTRVSRGSLHAVMKAPWSRSKRSKNSCQFRNREVHLECGRSGGKVAFSVTPLLILPSPVRLVLLLSLVAIFGETKGEPM
jgi:hypothetical protein